LGARALYLWQGNKDTLYRIHGTNEPWTIEKDDSSGCIRLINADIIDLYKRTPVGTKIVVLPSRNDTVARQWIIIAIAKSRNSDSQIARANDNCIH